MNARILLLGITLLLTSIQSLNAQSSFSSTRLSDGAVRFAKTQLGDDALIDVSARVTDQRFSESNVTARFTGERQSLRGSCNVGVEFSAGSMVLRRISIPLFVRIMRSVPVASMMINQGEQLRSNVQWQMRDVSSIDESTIPTEADIMTSLARRSLSKGMIITRSALVDAQGIRRGETVTLVSESGSVKIRARGTAMSDASIGEFVRVVRDGGVKTVISGKVEADKVVIITSNLTP